MLVIAIFVLDLLVLHIDYFDGLSFPSKVIFISFVVDYFVGGDKYEPAKCPIEIEFGEDRMQIISPERFVKVNKFEDTRFDIDYGRLHSFDYNEKTKYYR